MKNIIRKTLCMMLALIMVVGLLPIEAFAFDNTGWLWPVPSSTRMSRGFSDGHQAIDISYYGKNYSETDIYAAKAGTVYKVYSGCTNFSGYGSGITCQARGLCNPNAGYYEGYCNGGVGNGIIINHGGGVMSEYAHMSSVTAGLYEGVYVGKGQLLGYMGSYGMSTGPHLHFCIRENVSSNYWNGTPVNNNPYGDHYIVSGSWNKIDNIYYDTTGYGGTTAEVSVNWALDTSHENYFIGENNACIAVRGYVSNETTRNVTEIGCYLYDENGKYISHASENTTGLYQGSTDNVLMWYNMTNELGAVLNPGTDYSCMFYLILSGVQYNSQYFNFTTGGAKNYTVYYDANGGYGAPSPQTKKAGETITLASDVPIRDGYVFNGWTTDPESEYGQYLPGFTYSEDEDLYLYAAWSPEADAPGSLTITIHYDANGGYDAPGSESYLKGTEYTITSEAPSHDEYTFIGWSLSPYASQPDFWREYTFAAGEYYGDEITFYAVWASQIDIEYDANGGSGVPENGKLWTHYQNSVPANPTRSGYEFMGWQAEIFYIENGETCSFFRAYDEWSFIETGRAGEYEKIILKAVWKKNGETWADFYFKDVTAAPGETVRLELMIRNNDGTSPEWWTLHSPYSGSEYFELLEIETFEIEGDGVVAWYEFKVLENAQPSPYAFELDIANAYNDAGELRIYKGIIGTIIVEGEPGGEIGPVEPPVEEEGFLVEFDTRGGEGGPEDFYAPITDEFDGDGYAIFDIPEEIPTKAGYTFVGWQQNENGAYTNAYKAGKEAVTIWNDVTYYAVWNKNEKPLPVMTAESVTAAPGEEVTVKFYIENNRNIELCDVYEISADGRYNGHWDFSTILNCMSSNYSFYLSGDGLIYEFIFNINRDAEPGSYDFVATFPDGFNDDYESFVFIDVPFTVTVEDEGSGDDEETFAVTFDPNGGHSAPEDFNAPVEELYGMKYAIIDIPEEIPVKPGFVFVGWQQIENGYIKGAYKAGAEGFNIWDDVTFKAVWHREGTPMPVITAESVTVAPGETGTIKFFIENNNAIMLNGASSIGVNDDGDGHWYFSSLPVTEDTNYSDSLEGDGLIYEMSFDVNDDAAPAEYSFVVTFADGMSVDGESCVFIDIPFTVTVEREADVKTYTVTFDAMGGEGGPKTAIKYEYEDMIIPSEIPVKEGYKFIAWSFNHPFKEGYGFERRPGEIYEYDADITMYAVWAKEICKVTFTGENVPEDYEVEGGETIQLPALAREGYSFLGWKGTAKGEHEYTISFKAGDRIRMLNDWEFEALWEEISVTPTYTITYDANGGYGAPEAQKKEEGKDLIISSVVPKKDGYVFIAWQFMHPFTQGTYMEILPGEAYPFDASMKLTALWAKEECNITFKGESVPESYSVEGGSTFVFPEVSREGYKFLGWETHAANWQEGFIVMRQPGFSMRILDDMELTAVWEKLPSEEAIDLTVSSETLVLGGETTVSVEIEGGSKAVAMQFAVQYDAEKLNLESCTAGAVIKDTDPLINTNIPGIIIFAWDGLGEFTGEGSLLDMVFSAKEGVEAQDVEIRILTDSDEYDFIFADVDYNNIEMNVTNGVISIIDVIYGDVNGDGRVNVLDANLVRRCAAKLAELDAKQTKAADVDGNGKVNVLDANIVRRYAAKLIDKFPVEE
ncbi:MAG: InlB B-repeat-containing protein [Oscillospiraceae bacterium]|nr:InlB B-repeat-containing protein [Oscillospiraceae bacterium]